MTNIGNFHTDIERELDTKGFHILDNAKAQVPGNYPDLFPQYPEIQDVELGKSYVVRLFVRRSVQGVDITDSGMIDVRINCQLGNVYAGIIETTLPPDFPLHKGSLLTLKIEQILYQQTLRG